MSGREVIYLYEIHNGAHSLATDVDGGKTHITYYAHLEHVLSESGKTLADGCWVVDGRMVDSDKAFKEAVTGPIVDNRDTDEEPKGNALGHLAFTYVTPKTAAQRWKAVGAKVGQWSKDLQQVVWEN